MILFYKSALKRKFKKLDATPLRLCKVKLSWAMKFIAAVFCRYALKTSFTNPLGGGGLRYPWDFAVQRI